MYIFKIETKPRRNWPSATPMGIIAVILICLHSVQVLAQHSPVRRISAVVIDDFPPLYQTDKAGRPTGFAIDILEHIAKEAGIEVSYVKVSNWASALNLLRSGKADVIPGIGISAVREKEFVFTREIESIPVACFVRDHNTQIRGIDDLTGIKTAVIRQSVAYTRLKKRPDIVLEEYDTIEGALFALLAGEVDAFVFPQPVLESKARQIGVADAIKTVGKPLVDLKRGYLFRRSDAEMARYFNDYIESLVTSPDYRRMYLKWYGAPQTFWSARRIFILMVALLLASIVAMVVWRSVSLSRVNRHLAATVRKMRESQDALRRQQIYLESLQRNAPDPMFLSDMSGNILDVNERACEVLGYTRDELLTLTVMQVDAEYQELEPLAELWQRLELGTISRWSGVHRRKDGSTFPVEINAMPVNMNGERRMFGFARDISERTRLEAELRQSQKMQAIGQLAGGIAHDFNNILAGIMGYADLMLDSVDHGSPLARHINAIVAASERARGLVKQILTFSRRETEKMTATSLKPIIEEVLRLLTASIPSSIRITTDLAADAPMVLADDVKIHEAIMNLVTNAVYAMDSRGELRISLHKVRLEHPITGRHGDISAGIWAVITISDTGKGISTDLLDNIFDPFFTTKPVGEGTGLGLSVVYGIMRSHEGDIVVKSVPGEGTTFELYFPQTEVQPESETSELQKDAGGTEKILLVDDEEMLVDLGRQILESIGYEVTCHYSPIAALQAFNERPDDFDLIVTDQTMPELTGMELINAIREVRPQMPVILCTGYADVGNNKLFHRDNISHLVVKPYRVTTLRDAIRSVLDQRDSP